MSASDPSNPPEHTAAGIDAHEHHVDVGSAPPVRPMTGRRLIVLGAVAAVILTLLFIVTIIPRKSVEHELRAEAVARDSAPAVQVTTVYRAAPGSELLLPGTIQALHESAIYARVSGYVKRWQPDIGTVVHNGELLAEIDAPELAQSVEQAQAQLSQTRAALGLARADLERWKALARDSAVTGQELDQKQAAFEAAEANTGAADANLRRLVQNREFTRVTAPFTGVVTARNVDIGSLITPAGATSAPVSAPGSEGPGAGSLYRLAQTDTVRIYLTVPESYATSIRTGLTTMVSVQGIPGRTFTGRVARTSHAIDATSRTLLTEIDIPNRDLALLPGMSARATLHFPRATPPFLLPASALVIRSNGVQVMLVQPGTAGETNATIHFRTIHVARDYGATVEVADGVADGMTVVLNPNADLAEGSKVRVIPSPPAAAP